MAYQILGDKATRTSYDKFGKVLPKQSEGFVNMVDAQSFIFIGDAFADWVGEITLLKDHAADLTAQAAGEAEGTKTETEEDLRQKETKARLVEQHRERVKTVSHKLLDRISAWTEADKVAGPTSANLEKTRLEIERLKVEPFGVDILHAIGEIYVSKATTALRSKKFLGMGGFFRRARDKHTAMKDELSFGMSFADAQSVMKEVEREEVSRLMRGGEECTDELMYEYQLRIIGKNHLARWKGSKYEMQSVLRDVCDAVLDDENVPLEERRRRAEALVLLGNMMMEVR